MDDDEDLLDMSGEDLIRETQESLATFSRNIVKKLGICQTTGMGTETVNDNNHNTINCCQCQCYIIHLSFCYDKIGL